jgi:hypothetical protein
MRRNCGRSQEQAPLGVLSADVHRCVDQRSRSISAGEAAWTTHHGQTGGTTVDDDSAVDYPWLAHRDERFTLALILDVGEVLVRHGFPAPAGATLVDLTSGLYRALHPTRYQPPTMD